MEIVVEGFLRSIAYTYDPALRYHVRALNTRRQSMHAHRNNVSHAYIIVAQRTHDNIVKFLRDVF
jgi:hypothetical protein